jgi:hypothetical protein
MILKPTALPFIRSTTCLAIRNVHRIIAYGNMNARTTSICSVAIDSPNFALMSVLSYKNNFNYVLMYS